MADGQAEILMDNAAAFFPGGLPMPAQKRAMLSFGIGDDVDAENRGNKGRGLQHVFIDGVMQKLCHADGVCRAGLGFVQAMQVVLRDGAFGTNAGQNALAPAAKAAHQMMDGAADENDFAIYAQGIDPHLRAARGGADIHQRFGLAIVIFHPDGLIDFRGNKAAHFLFGHGAMGAEGNEDDDVFPLYAEGLREIAHQAGDDEILPHPKAGDIADDDGDLIFCRDKTGKRRAVDGAVCYGVQKGGIQFLNGRDGPAGKHLDGTGVFNGKGQGLPSVLKGKGLRCHKNLPKHKRARKYAARLILVYHPNKD